MFCTACGARNTEISNFCKQCGHKIDHAAVPRISEEAFDRALPLEEQVSALLERAYRLRKSGELSAAARLCEEALRLNPESTSVHSLLGQIHEQTGNRDAALREYERVLQLNPGSIADRVKLDELRGDGLPVPLHPRTSPHIVMPNRAQPNPNGRQMLGIAGIAGALMALGGLLALQFIAHQDKNGSQAANGTSRNSSRLAANTPQTDPISGSLSNGTSSAPQTSNTVNPNAPGSPSGLPANATYTGMASYPPSNAQSNRPIIIHDVIHDSAPVSMAVRNGGLPNLRGLRTQPINDNSEERVHLDGNEKPYNITIHANGDSTEPADNGGTNTPPKGANPAKGGGNAVVSKGAAPKTNPPIIEHIHVNQPPAESGNAGANLAAPSTEAQSLIAIASDKFKMAEYDTAIRAYRRALAGAGSQKAYVFMQMGICFQHIKDKASAINNFHTAIEEYQKLESAHQQVDLARVGIKVCENGIKICTAE